MATHLKIVLLPCLLLLMLLMEDIKPVLAKKGGGLKQRTKVLEETVKKLNEQMKQQEEKIKEQEEKNKVQELKIKAMEECKACSKIKELNETVSELQEKINSKPDIDECSSNSHSCDVNAVCSNTPGSYTCTCKAGFSGDGKSCVDVDECSDSVCDVSATCQNTAGSFICSCKAGFTGDGKTCTGLVPVCGPVGVADRNIIPDARMTASTTHSRDLPHYGRLNGKRHNGVWCTKENAIKADYLQVDMGAVHSVCAVATQGPRNDVWVTQYKLHLSTDGVTWNAYKENNVEKVFQEQRYRTGVVHALLNVSEGRFVRFYPITYHYWPCMGVEIFVLKK